MPICSKRNFDNFMPYIINSKYIKDLNVKPKILKFLGEKSWIREWFLKYDTKTKRSVREETDTLYLIKTKSLCSLRHIANRMKR